ncbi:MAG: Osmosensitive channel histidine kinase KdpD [Myxococcaceae bacterium]|nr:Osmosensitive channel histidine kinase KdpD [Myxococcaceae bacterium]
MGGDRPKERGKLTIFFGAAPGVGKTYAMLEASRFEREDGRDVVAGIVETHGRYDTGALLLGLELLPRRKFDHRGVLLEELDVDAAVARRPGVLLVDELAHSNAPGSRHAKRWQDVEDLLDLGIDVYATLNVQHLESLNDVVAQITHVTVRETVPDSVLEKADDIRLIDLPIDELLARMKEGKVYVPEHARVAEQNFFRPGNLIALREMALRVTAQAVDAQMRRYKEAHGIEGTWAATERVLVCVSASPSSARLVRGARRLASSLHADWIAAHVEAPSLVMSARERAQVTENLQLARTLGADSVTLSGSNGALEVIDFARQRNVTRIVVGKPTHPRWRDRIRRSFLDEIVRLSGDIDVHVIRGDESEVESEAGAQPPAATSPETAASRIGYVAGAAIPALATLIDQRVFDRTQLADIVMVYMAGIVVVAMRWSMGPALFSALLSVLAFDFFFIPPYGTLEVADLSHIATFAVMFLIAALINGLMKRVRDQAESARRRELRTASLYALSRALAAAKTRQEVLEQGTKHVQEVFGGRTAALVPAATGALVARVDEPWTYALDEKERSVAEWVLEHGRSAGLGTDTMPSATALYLPLEGSDGQLGVLGLVPASPSRLADDHGRQHLEAFVRQIAAALDRAHLGVQAHQAQLRVEAEQLRNSLLSSVSHDLRTPLAVITGTASALTDDRLDPAVRRDLAETIVHEAERLNRLVRNLLDVTRLEAGALRIEKEWQPVEEVIGAALGVVDRVLGNRPVATDVAPDLLAPFDAVLVQQVLVNLLENAVKYTAPESPLTVSASKSDEEVEIVVADRGPGLPDGEETRIFEKFYRAEKGKGGGAGLGLTICKGVVTAHGGRIWAVNREGGGAAFHFTLPAGAPPQLDLPDSERAAEGAGA